MRNIYTITRRELASFFVSPMAYVILTLVLLLIGFVFFRSYVMQYSLLSLESSRNPMWASQLNIQDMLIRGFYSTFGVIMMFVAPFLAMRVLAEEKRQGTAEMLLTMPVTTSQLVLGKYLGVLTFGSIMLLLTLQYPLYLRIMGASLAYGPLASVYLGCFLMMASFLAAGVFASSLTSNQIIAALVAFVICLFFWMVGYMGEVGGDSNQYSELLKHLSISEHYEDFLKGVIDTGSVVYHLMFITFGLFLTQRVIDSSRWR